MKGMRPGLCIPGEFQSAWHKQEAPTAPVVGPGPCDVTWPRLEG